jgi:phosphatidylglycerophosphatase A
MSKIIATVFYVGYLKPAPGTWGSFAALPLAWAILSAFGPFVFCLSIAAVFALGIWATDKETAGQENHDPSEIVIDEVAGQWVALLPVAFGAVWTQAELLDLWPGWIAAFVLFRLFDITKPSLVGWADKRDDAIGVMLDDIFAGVFAAIGVIICAMIAHLVL